MRRFRSMILAATFAASLVLSLGTAQALTCGGPWTGPNGTNCSFVSSGGTLTFGGFATNIGAAGVGIMVFSPPGVFLTQCTDWQPGGFAACGQATTMTIPLGQTVICVVKGIQAGAYTCSA